MIRNASRLTTFLVFALLFMGCNALTIAHSFWSY